MVALAIATGIAPSVWADEGDQAIVTAWELLQESQRASTPRGKGAEGRQMSG